MLKMNFLGWKCFPFAIYLYFILFYFIFFHFFVDGDRAGHLVQANKYNCLEI